MVVHWFSSTAEQERQLILTLIVFGGCRHYRSPLRVVMTLNKKRQATRSVLVGSMLIQLSFTEQLLEVSNGALLAIGSAVRIWQQRIRPLSQL